MSFYLQLRHYYGMFEVGICVLNYILTFYIIYLALHKMNRTMQEFRLIIVLSCFVELLYNTATLIVMPIVELSGGVLFMLNLGFISHAKPRQAVFATSTWLFTVFLLVVNNAMIFLYRYKIVCQRHGFTMRKFVIMYVILTIYAAVHSYACMITAENDMTEEYTQLLFKTKVFVENTPTPVIFNTMKFKPFAQLVHAQWISCLAYSIIIFSGYRVHKCLIQSQQVMSKQTISVQNQLSKIMVLQITPLLLRKNVVVHSIFMTTFGTQIVLNLKIPQFTHIIRFYAMYPAFAMVFPVVICCSAAMLNLTIPFIGLFVGSTMAFIPVLNSLLIIWVIPSFRRATLRLFCLKRLESKISSNGGFSTHGREQTDWPTQQPVNNISDTVF